MTSSSGRLPFFRPDPREEGGEAVIIVLRPALERMVVALGALDADAQEELGGGLDRVLGVAADPVVVRGRIRKVEPSAVSSSRTNWSIGVFRSRLALDPAVEDVRPLGLDQPAVGAEDVGELEGPEVVELGPVEQPIDDLVAAVASAGIGQERLDLRGSRAGCRSCRGRPGG